MSTFTFSRKVPIDIAEQSDYASRRDELMRRIGPLPGPGILG